MSEVEQASPKQGYSRRALLGAFGAGAVVVAGAGAAGAAIVTREEAPSPASLTYPFYGPVQQGITTPMQDTLHFASLDVTTESREALIALLKSWTLAAAAMTQGLPVGRFGAEGMYDAPPEDTGEAVGLPPSGLTITFGFGPSLFRTVDGRDRFGLASQQPRILQQLPHFPRDMINPAISNGDLCIQACANNPQVAVHAVRNLVRLAFGTAAVRWSQNGFGKSSSTSNDTATPRNLMGFKDGTNNIKGDDTAEVDNQVWVQPTDNPAWMDDGTYMAVRKIRMTIETWDRTSLREQELVFGRSKIEGAPLSGGSEFADPNFKSLGRENEPLIPTDSHVAIAHPDNNDGHRVLRRGYNYTDSSDALGRLDAGLFFIGFARNLQTQFVPLQMRLSQNDRMNEYVRYIGDAAFAVPPGVSNANGYIGEPLFNATA